MTSMFVFRRNAYQTPGLSKESIYWTRKGASVLASIRPKSLTRHLAMICTMTSCRSPAHGLTGIPSLIATAFPTSVY